MTSAAIDPADRPALAELLATILQPTRLAALH